jgi:ArsR family transcriptional regulator
MSGYFKPMKNIAYIFKALSDETRLRILALLSSGEICVCDLMEALELPQSTVSRHLAYLRNAGLVDDERRGVWMFYRLKQANVLGDEFLCLLLEKLKDSHQVQSDQRALNQLSRSSKKKCS